MITVTKATKIWVILNMTVFPSFQAIMFYFIFYAMITLNIIVFRRLWKNNSCNISYARNSAGGFLVESWVVVLRTFADLSKCRSNVLWNLKT